MKPVALLFDVDGTLAETERDGHRVAFNETFAAHGMGWHWDERLYGELLQISGGRERMQAYARSFDPEWLEVGATSERLARLHEEKNQRYAARLANGHVRLRPGVANLMRTALDAGCRLGVVTTTSRSNLQALWRHVPGLPALGSLAVQVCGEDVRCKKPHPEAYRLALSQLAAAGVAAGSVLVFEDSANGLQAAHQAGLRTIVTPSWYTRDEDFSLAWLCASDLNDVQVQHALSREGFLPPVLNNRIMARAWLL